MVSSSIHIDSFHIILTIIIIIVIVSIIFHVCLFVNTPFSSSFSPTGIRTIIIKPIRHLQTKPSISLSCPQQSTSHQSRIVNISSSNKSFSKTRREMTYNFRHRIYPIFSLCLCLALCLSLRLDSLPSLDRGKAIFCLNLGKRISLQSYITLSNYN